MMCDDLSHIAMRHAPRRGPSRARTAGRRCEETDNDGHDNLAIFIFWLRQVVELAHMAFVLKWPRAAKARYGSNRRESMSYLKGRNPSGDAICIGALMHCTSLPSKQVLALTARSQRRDCASVAFLIGLHRECHKASR
jgi:hypothetical protein